MQKRFLPGSSLLSDRSGTQRRARCEKFCAPSTVGTCPTVADSGREIGDHPAPLTVASNRLS